MLIIIVLPAIVNGISLQFSAMESLSLAFTSKTIAFKPIPDSRMMSIKART
jgi:hypothetical protein